MNSSLAVTVTISSSGKVVIKVGGHKLSGARIDLNDKGHYIFHRDKRGWNEHDDSRVGMSIDINLRVKNELTGYFNLYPGGGICCYDSVEIHARKTR